MDEVDERLRSLPNKSKIAFSELGCFPEKRSGKTKCKSHDVDVKWIRNPSLDHHETYASSMLTSLTPFSFLEQVRTFIVVGANPHILGVCPPKIS